MIFNLKILKNKKKDVIIIPEFFGKDQMDYIVAERLLNHVINNQDNPVITYGKLAKKIGSDFDPQNLRGHLGNISDVCKENCLTFISSIVVNKDTALA